MKDGLSTLNFPPKEEDLYVLEDGTPPAPNFEIALLVDPEIRYIGYVPNTGYIHFSSPLMECLSCGKKFKQGNVWQEDV